MEKKNSLNVQLLQMTVWVFISAGAILFLNVMFKTDYPVYLYIIFIINLIFIYTKFICSYLFRRRVEKKKQIFDICEVRGNVSVIIPCYNESLDVIKVLLQQLSEQTLLPYEIIFIDDCSSDTAIYEYVYKTSLTSDLNIRLERFRENSGKLKAIKWGIEHAQGDYLLFIDADSYILQDGISNMLAPLYYDETIGASCGQVVPLNKDENFLTRMQETTYYNAYNLGRQHQSFFNKVLVCSGAISMYRKQLIIPYIDQLLNSRFSKHTRTTGDDIVMTNIIIKHGFKTAYIENAVCYTHVPTKLKDFYLQQLRWVKDAYYSFFEEFDSILKKPVFFILQLQEVFYWLISLIALLYFLFSYHVEIDLHTLLLIFAYTLIISLVENFYVITVKKQSIFKSWLYDYTYRWILMTVRVVGLLFFTRRKWRKHSTQKLDGSDESFIGSTPGEQGLS